MRLSKKVILMRIMQSKKGFIGLWADVFKGFIFGLLAGIVLMLLVNYKVIPIGIELCKCAVK
jgi:hypothetical protein